MKAFKVYSETGWIHDRNGRLIRVHTDKVFYGDKCTETCEDVRRSLVDHDGYPSDTVVVRSK